MRNLYRAGLFAAALMILTGGFATDTYAQRWNYGYGTTAGNPAVYNGYQLGYGAGSNDRAYGNSFNVGRHEAYDDGDSGYSGSGYGSKGEYRQVFRSAFQQGYRDGYNGSPRQAYYPGDVFNNGGTAYPYNNRRVRDRRYYPRYDNNRYWPY